MDGSYGVGITTKGQEFYFDLEDFNLIKRYTWCLNHDGYVVAWDRNAGKFIYMHRLVMGLSNKEKLDLDHIFHITFDNRKENLRICTHQQNIQNSAIGKNNTSGVTGVTWNAEIRKWVAQIFVDGKRIELLSTDDFGSAVDARKQAEEQYFGEYSYKEKEKA